MGTIIDYFFLTLYSYAVRKIIYIRSEFVPYHLTVTAFLEFMTILQNGLQQRKYATLYFIDMETILSSFCNFNPVFLHTR